MNLFHALLLGIVEGLTEFLPVSSTAHLILTSNLLGLPQTETLKSFEISIQTGAILAVILLYWRSLLRGKEVILKILAAFVPTAIIGLALHGIVKQYLLASVPVVLWSLLIGGMVLIAFDWFHREKDSHTADLGEMSYMQAIVIGLFQSIAIIPGVSRSAATIIGGELMGMKRTAIVDFSFLLAIPTLGAAAALDLVKSADTLSASDIPLFAVGTMTSFIVAYISSKWFLGYIKNHSFVVFGVYRILIGVIGFWFLVSGF